MKVLITTELGPEHVERIQASCHGVEVLYRPAPEANAPLAADDMHGVDALFFEMSPSNFADVDGLKWVQLTSAGYAQVLDLPILERGIRVTNGLGNFDIPIAEWNILMMLFWHRRMPELLANHENKVWDRDGRFQAEFRGSTVGLYGYGGLARETARLAKAMGLNVWALTRNGETRSRDNTYCVPGTGDPEGILPDRVFSAEQDEDFFAGLDYLVLAIPLTPVTEGIIRERELKLLQPSAVLLNPARGPLIELDALVRCMNEGWIRGASLDTHYAYPLPEDHPVWTLPNVVLSPHISGSAASPHYAERVCDIFIENVRRFRDSEALLNELSPAQLRGE